MRTDPLKVPRRAGRRLHPLRALPTAACLALLAGAPPAAPPGGAPPAEPAPEGAEPPKALPGEVRAERWVRSEFLSETLVLIERGGPRGEQTEVHVLGDDGGVAAIVPLKDRAFLSTRDPAGFALLARAADGKKGTVELYDAQGKAGASIEVPEGANPILVGDGVALYRKHWDAMFAAHDFTFLGPDGKDRAKAAEKDLSFLGTFATPPDLLGTVNRGPKGVPAIVLYGTDGKKRFRYDGPEGSSSIEAWTASGGARTLVRTLNVLRPESASTFLLDAEGKPGAPIAEAGALLVAIPAADGRRFLLVGREGLRLLDAEAGTIAWKSEGPVWPLPGPVAAWREGSGGWVCLRGTPLAERSFQDVTLDVFVPDRAEPSKRIPVAGSLQGDDLRLLGVTAAPEGDVRLLFPKGVWRIPADRF